jgi:hypothetical protein
LKRSQTFRFFAHGAFVLEPWTNAIKGKKLPAPNLILWICSKEKGDQRISLFGQKIGLGPFADLSVPAPNLEGSAFHLLAGKIKPF